MHTMRVLSIIGTRPEALKMAPVIAALTRAGIDSLVCTTGQHRELLAEPLELFGISSQFNLALMRSDQAPHTLAAMLLARLAPVVTKARPDWILAAGDTTSVLGAALTAAYSRVRFGHVEAGLRTGDNAQPFPEELHRRLAAVVADLHFAPTKAARNNLLRENVPIAAIVVTGNPIVDTLRQISASRDEAIPPAVLQRLAQAGNRGHAPQKLLLVTFHRRENYGRPVANICIALRELAREFADELSILCLVHPNPRVSKPARRLLCATPGIVLSPPVSYPAMLSLIKRATLVLTDSGGVQEEAPYLQTPVLVLRQVTERPEGIAAGVARLVGTDPGRIVAATRCLLRNARARTAMVDKRFDAYGDGHAAGRIVAALRRQPITASL